MTIQPIADRVVPGGNHRRLFRFDNGFGASVIRGQYTYGGTSGLFELAVLKVIGDGPEDFELTYDTPITDDVIGWLDENQVQVTLAQIQDLPNAKEAAR